jgi:hypothetical protein
VTIFNENPEPYTGYEEFYDYANYQLLYDYTKFPTSMPADTVVIAEFPAPESGLIQIHQQLADITPPVSTANANHNWINVNLIVGGVSMGTSMIDVTYNAQYLSAKVVKGQQVRITARAFEVKTSIAWQTGSWIRFIPMSFVTAPQTPVVVQPGSDLSLFEQPVMIRDSLGVIRQKKDYDGSPIFCKMFVGTVTGVANIAITTILAEGIKRVCVMEGDWDANRDSNTNTLFPITFSAETIPTLNSHYAVRKGTHLLTWISNSNFDRSNHIYRFYAEYTKI